jgi:glycerol kinase
VGARGKREARGRTMSPSRPLLLGIDAGTTAVKAALFDCELREVEATRRAIAVAHPRPGWVEQDPEQILSAVVDAVAELLERAGAREIVAAGLDHQGESVLAWNDDGRALTPVIVWQDKRQEQLLAQIDEREIAKSGLPLDPYFSAGKLAWLLEHDAAVRGARDAGTLRLGTVDAFIADRLGGRFATDLSTASRTQLLAVGGRDWDPRLLSAFGLRREWLPAVGPSFGALGELRHERWPAPIRLTAQLVDQQAALAGSGAVRPGELKASYGTGVFVLGRTERVPEPGGRLLPTVAWATPDEGGHAIGEVAYALDGGVFAAGSLLDWLAGGLGLAGDASGLAALAATVPDSARVLVLPALAGLGAPWWRAGAHGVIAGLHAGARPAHVARAALEAIAWRVADIVEQFAREAGPPRELRVDGGLTSDPTLLQLQADATGVALTVGPVDTTVLGAALLAGVGAGEFASVERACELLPPGRTVAASAQPAEREHLRARWRSFVQAAAEL